MTQSRHQRDVSVCRLLSNGTILRNFILDEFRIHQWFNREMDYLCTIDYCCFPEFKEIHFSDQPLRSMCIPNAGGASEISEALSMQYMNYLFGVTEFIPEREVDYWIEYKMCDYLMQLKDFNVGVSVTRAVLYPFQTEFTYDHAVALLKRKLYGLIIARNTVNLRHQFFKSILHIWCYSELTAINLRKAYQDLVNDDANKTYATIYVICSICSNQYIYTNRVENGDKGGDVKNKSPTHVHLTR